MGLQSTYFVLFILSFNNNSSNLTVLQSQYISTQRILRFTRTNMQCEEHFYPLLTISLCLVASAIVPQLFPPRDHLQICGSQDLSSALSTDGNRPDIIRPSSKQQVL
jgi:hypothetical protein